MSDFSIIFGLTLSPLLRLLALLVVHSYYGSQAK